MNRRCVGLAGTRNPPAVLWRRSDIDVVADDVVRSRSAVRLGDRVFTREAESEYRERDESDRFHGHSSRDKNEYSTRVTARFTSFCDFCANEAVYMNKTKPRSGIQYRNELSHASFFLFRNLSDKRDARRV